MFTQFERTIAGRYLRARKGERFVSIIAIFSLVGIALGVATLIVVASVMTGFQTEVVSRVLAANGHVVLQAYAGEKIEGYARLATDLAALPGVTAATPVLDGQVLVTGERGGGAGALMRGITGADLRALSQVRIIAGTLDNFHGDDALVVGAGLAASFRLAPGSKLTLVSPQGAATAFGTIPRVRAYRVVAVFDAGLSTFNNGVVFLPMAAAQVFLQTGNAVSGIELRLADPTQARAMVNRIRPLLGTRKLLLRDWTGANDQIVAVLQIQKNTMFIVLGMIIVVAAFNVISSLIMLVKDKRRDIAVLRTLGASSGAMLRIFIMCGAFVGVAGTVLGTILGITVCWNLEAIQHAIESLTGGQVFDSSVFLLTALPNNVHWPSVIQVVALALVLSLLATLYPSWKAARTDPVEVLRNE
ncbi:MAG: lipoprotein-releasing ABC transporter permease subunit [Acetobacteraceae bacterium]|nr:lipoprotein-releasing ABC transporter permease subunit [Acetobacteraceae bacterium]